MYYMLAGILLMVLLGEAASRPQTPAEQFQAIQDSLNQDYQVARREFDAALREAKTDDERKKVYVEKFPRTSEIVARHAGQFLELAQDNPDDPVAFDALLWVLKAPFAPEAEKAAEILVGDHIKSERLGPVCWQMVLSGGPALGSEPAERLVREALQRSPHREVRAFACLALALHLKQRTEVVLTLGQSDGDKVTPSGAYIRDNLVRVLGQDGVRRLKEDDAGRLAEEAERLLQRVVEQFADVKIPSASPEANVDGNSPTQLGEMAKRDLTILRNQSVGRQRDLSVGAKIPEIEGRDVDGRPMRLSDFHGKVVVLDFWTMACAPCMAMKPHEQTLVKRLEGEPFALLGICGDQDPDQVKALMEKRGITWRSWLDGEGTIAAQWLVYAVPTTYVIDANGIIRYKDVRGEEMDKAVEALLKERESK